MIVLAATALAGVSGAVVTTVASAQPAAALPPGATKTVHLSTTFSSTNQSMWGPGTAAPPTDFTNSLFDETWNGSSSGGSITDVSFDPCFGVLGGCSIDLGRFGMSGTASGSGEIGMSSTLHNSTGGSVNVSYPAAVDLTMPADDTFAPGDPVTISSSAPAVGTGSITSSYPSFDSFSLDGKFGFHASVTGSACLFGCFLDNTNLLSVDLPSSGIASGSLFTLTKSQLESVPGFGLSHCFNFADNALFGLSSYSNASDPSVHQNCNGNGYVAFPDVNLASSMSGDTLKASGADTYVVVPVATMVWALRLAGANLPPGFPNLSADLGDGVKIGYTTTNIIYTTLLKEYQDLSFKASGFNVGLSLPQSVPWTVTDASNTPVASGTGSSITLPAGDKVTFNAPGPMHITPTLTMTGNTFTNHTYDKLQENGEVKYLSLTFETPSATCCGGVTIWPGTGIDVGPVADINTLDPINKQPITLTGFDVLPPASWTLGGFSPVTLAAFDLSPDPIPTPTPSTITPVEGAAITTTVARFADPDPSDATTIASTSYTAKINWGDGSAVDTAVTITGTNSSFAVGGTHTYLEEGTYHPVVAVTDSDLPHVTAYATSTANVSDAALHSSGKSNSTSFVSGKPVLLWPNPPASGTLASFTDDDPNGTLTDFSATVDWGDGKASVGSIKANGSGGWDVSGSHTYATLGEYPVTVKVTDGGGSTTTANLRILTYAFSAGGNFVIGNKNLPPTFTRTVTFWGSQWWQLNSLSAGASPASFKGFINRPATSSCGVWSTDTGNSAGPPASVPSYQSVLVTRSVVQGGSTLFSGATAGYAVVRTNAGYGPSPGQPGTGTVVAMISTCP